MRPLRVVVADDERLLREQLCARLREPDASIEVLAQARNGQEALERVRDLQPDLVFLDIRMPVMTGIDFLRQLRVTPDGNKPVVLFCTSENDFKRIQEALVAGANEYIFKPFDSEILQSKFRQVGLI